MGARADQIITGTAITLAPSGSPAPFTARHTATGVRAQHSHAFGPFPAWSLRIPVLGPAFFDQPAPTYLAFAALPLVWWVLFRTRLGLALRATGEGAAMARAAGVRTGLIRAGATIVGGGFAGLAGRTLVLAQVGTFAERMTAGRGYAGHCDRGSGSLASGRCWRWERCSSEWRPRCNSSFRPWGSCPISSS